MTMQDEVEAMQWLVGELSTAVRQRVSDMEIEGLVELIERRCENLINKRRGVEDVA